MIEQLALYVGFIYMAGGLVALGFCMGRDTPLLFSLCAAISWPLIVFWENIK